MARHLRSVALLAQLPIFTASFNFNWNLKHTPLGFRQVVSNQFTSTLNLHAQSWGENRQKRWHGPPQNTTKRPSALEICTNFKLSLQDKSKLSLVRHMEGQVEKTTQKQNKQKPSPVHEQPGLSNVMQSITHILLVVDVEVQQASCPMLLLGLLRDPKLHLDPCPLNLWQVSMPQEITQSLRPPFSKFKVPILSYCACRHTVWDANTFHLIAARSKFKRPILCTQSLRLSSSKFKRPILSI